MTAQEYRAICNALISKHHEQLREAAIQRNDANAAAQETAILSKIKANI